MQVENKYRQYFEAGRTSRDALLPFKQQIYPKLKANLKTLAIGLVLASAAGMTFTACNSSEEVAYTLPSSATVRSFTLSPDAKILPNLDSVFFTIDLDNLSIYNADSLPYGTKVTALTPVITTESASVVELVYKNKEGEETTLNYLENTTDTIDFTSPVKMRVVSNDARVERTYTINVNVHKMPVDSMVWSRIEGSSLPTPFSAVNEQHTAMSPAGTFYCMTRYQSDYAVACTTDPAGTWDMVRCNLSFKPDINSFTATNDALYILDAEGNLYTSTDEGVDWTPTGKSAAGMVGAYGNRLLATAESGSVWSIMEYPAGNIIAAPDGFPVRNASPAIALSFEMAVNPQLIVVGGRKADGTLTGDTWGFDGTSWANITRRPIAEKLENMALVPYFELKPDTTSWKASDHTTVLLAMGGNRIDGSLNDTVYMSYDFGMTWDKAPDMMQIPTKVMPARKLAQAYPHTGVSHTKAASAKLPEVFSSHVMEWRSTGYEVPALRNSVMARITKPLTEWEVPYIYMFGGVNADGATYNTVFRGAILGLTYKPVE